MKRGRAIAAVDVVESRCSRSVPSLGPREPGRDHASLSRRAGPGQEEDFERAQPPASPALRLARIAQAEMASDNLRAAEKTFPRLFGSTRTSARAWFGVALLELQSGNADATLDACREGLSTRLTEPRESVP